MLCGGINDGGYRTSNRNFPTVSPPTEIPSCCCPVPCSSCCWNPCIPCCCPRACGERRRPCPRPRLSLTCPPDSSCPTPCPIFKCCPAPCSSPTLRANADTSYLVPVPQPPRPSVIVRPKVTCPNSCCQTRIGTCPLPSVGVEGSQRIGFY